MNRLVTRNKICYNIISESRLWSKRLGKIRKIIHLILDNPLNFINKQYTNYYITFLLTDNVRIKKLNKRYKKIFKPTDVLIFTTSQKINENKKIRICDIAISASYLKRDAARLKIDFYEHFTHIIIHALLHSNDYNHHNKKETLKMQSKEIEILKKFNIKNPYLI